VGIDEPLRLVVQRHHDLLQLAGEIARRLVVFAHARAGIRADIAGLVDREAAADGALDVGCCAFLTASP
jgi:hypothetical protein